MTRICKIDGNLYRFLTGDTTARRLTADNFFSKGLDAEEIGDKNKALELYRQTLAYDPSNAGALLNIGTILFGLWKIQGAEKCYRHALEVNPGYALAHFNLGCLLDEKRYFRQATERYLEAIRIDPTCAHAHFNLALEYERWREYRQAINCFRSYIRYGSDDGRVALAEARREIDWLRERDLSLVRKSVVSEISDPQSRKIAQR